MSDDRDRDFWFARLSEDIASIDDASRRVVATFALAEIEYAHGLHDAARATMTSALASFGVFHPGTWTSLVYRAAELCPRLGLNHLLEPELARGRAWAADTEVWRYNTVLKERVHDLALQLLRADVAAEVLPEADLLEPAKRAAVDMCVLAGWARDAVSLRRKLPAAEAMASATGDFYRLIRACTACGLLADAARLVVAGTFPLVATTELLAAQWRDDANGYRRLHDAWEAWLRRRFNAEPQNHHFSAADLRHCAEVARRLGDRDGFEATLASIRQIVVDTWMPSVDWVTCVVYCDLAVLYHRAGSAEESRRWFDEARRIKDGGRADLSRARGSGSLMSSVLADASLEVGDIKMALRHARGISARAERRNAIVSARILGGMRTDALNEIGKIESAEERSSLIEVALRRALWSGRDYPPGALPFDWFTKLQYAGPNPC